MRGTLLGLVRDALLACFDADGLRQLTATHLDKELDHIAGGNDLTEIAWNLVVWADKAGRLAELVRAAAAERPQATADWDKLARIVASRMERAGRRMDYEGGAWERRIEGKLDELMSTVNRLDVRLSIVESKSSSKPESSSLPVGAYWAALLIMGLLIAVGTVIAIRLP